MTKKFAHSSPARQPTGSWRIETEASLLSERQAFDEWLLASPVHVEEYLGVALIAQALPTAADDPENPLDAILERAGTVDEADVRLLRANIPEPPTILSARPVWNRWQFAVAAVLAVVIGGFLWWNADHRRPTALRNRPWRTEDLAVWPTARCCA